MEADNSIVRVGTCLLDGQALSTHVVENLLSGWTGGVEDCGNKIKTLYLFTLGFITLPMDYPVSWECLPDWVTEENKGKDDQGEHWIHGSIVLPYWSQK